jgi:glycine hydroxymethyltransferase
MLSPGDTILGMDLSHGGHLTHGAPVSHMGKLFRFVRYKTRTDRGGAIDFDEVRKLALEVRPKMVLCGHSSYPRELDYARFKAIADEVGALTMADVSHLGGLIAAGVLDNPMDAGFDFVTTTTHKSLRGPRSGLILCRGAHAKAIDSSVFPGLQGGPHMNVIAGVAIALRKATTPEFRAYAETCLASARAMAEVFVSAGATLITGGTENHLIVIDTVKSFGLDGREAERVLDDIGLATNKQVIPDDPNPPMRPSGVRLGTPACTSRGMGIAEMRLVAEWMGSALRGARDAGLIARLRSQVRELALRFPVPGIS